ncbi:winged helix-turn-helix domain-containing protein [Haloglomus litoreum]|uniref:winged helix-turn-helix domain-containing protein n=1 Tax=Haloglomus litoreum TaxID=3034026 RepID=UPI0023E804F4|nr:helix-turn-helix domain-containing protein [Haloglomus sp. DT116]
MTSDDSPTDGTAGRPTAGGVGDGTIDATRSAAAFGAVANETRLSILRSLWAADGPQSFSTLREAVGVRDSGRFNYHLGELTGRFVRKASADDGEDRDDPGEGYVLTYAGEQVVGAVHSGLYSARAEIDPFDAGTCPDCGGTLRAEHADETVSVTCGGCGVTVTQFGAPPTLLAGFDEEELPLAFSHWVQSMVERTRRGFCPQCSGRVRAGLTRELQETVGLYGARFDCEVCGGTVTGALGAVVLDHPAVVAFHADHGIDLRTDPFWEVPWLLDQPATVESEDPLRVRLVAEIGDDRLSLRLDERLEVLAAERDP